ncbi:MAG: DNA mismatch repair protein MutS [Desulfobacterales bacterium]|jgi:DNA mismatch repair protein MutS|nr:DNA mismatch repair protein MutS [Desulfobacterales bacterium]
MTAPKSTPMLRQYLQIKGDYPDAILFYRMGDFYEMFFEDAETAARVLDITLTSRNKNDESPVPMCGVPYRAATGYIARLIENGFKVAVCDQVEDPAAAKGLVKREVVRVITPGMIIDEEFLDARSHNFILALARSGPLSGLAYLDISTGIFRVTESTDAEAIREELHRVGPKEVLLPESARSEGDDRLVGSAAATYLEDRDFDYARAYRRLTDQFQTINLEGFGCEHFRAGVAAAGALMAYVAETQKQKTAHITRLESYGLGGCLVVDQTSRLNLELIRSLRTGSRRGSLLAVLDHTRTPMGARLFQSWLLSPLSEREPILERQAAVAAARERVLVRRALREVLASVADLERLGSKTVMNRVNARDLTALRRSLQALPAIWSELGGFSDPLLQPPGPIEALSELAALIERAIREDAPPTIHEGHMIKPGFHPELDELVAIGRDTKGYLARLEQREREATGINTLKVSYNRVFGYYIEVPKARAHQTPGHYVRKQTLVNAERYITDELKGFETKVLGAEQARAELEHRLFQEIREAAAAQYPRLQEAARFLARLDCLLNLAEVADRNHYCRPAILDEGRILIDEGRHPVVEKTIGGERFVPNSIEMDDTANQVLIITGPNMAGKSTVLRQTALLVIMAQMGGFVPARKAALGIVDRIFTRVGALDNLSQGQSTFMVEMQETANILNHATGRSLVVLDEIGRGTSTYDGLSIAWAVAEYLHDLNGAGVKTLFATHYHELTDLADRKPRVKNFSIAVKEWNDDIIFLHKLVPGGTNRSYGIQVARLAGVPPPVIGRAKKILFGIESGEHGAPAVSTAGRSAKPVPTQLDLFRTTEAKVLELLRAADLEQLTPLEAMNLLSRLQELAGKRGPETST